MLPYLTDPNEWPAKARAAGWCAGKLAVLCNVSLRTLERHFLKEMGKSPKGWLKEHRQNTAAKLIGEGRTVKAVASALGYRHPGQFSRDFRRHWGHAPTFH
jgi:transcriptional regulator GlxA family with amidase domain